MALIDLRSRLVLLVLGFYLILNVGFMLIRVPVVQVPIGELLLVLYFLWISDIKWINNFGRSVFLLPFLVLWVLGISQTLLGVQNHGVWALRDATHIVDSLFIWIGFVCAAKPEFTERFFQWFPKILLLAGIYILAFPAAPYLMQISPKITALAGYQAPIFFHYVNTPTLVFVGIAYLMLFDKKVLGIPNIYIVSMLAAFVLITNQSRTVYLQLAAMFFILVLYRRHLLKNILMMFSAMILIGILILSLDIEITGRIGQKFSFEFIGKHFLSIFGIGSEGVSGAAAGSNMRLEWWGHLWRKLTSSEVSFFFGLGFGVPLTDFKINDLIVVREPHNSAFSVFARIGFIGLIAFIWMHVNLFRVWRGVYWRCAANGDRNGQNNFLILLVYFILTLVFCIGEDGLEKPFNAIPYYFFWGVILHYSLHLKNAMSVAKVEADTPGAQSSVAWRSK